MTTESVRQYKYTVRVSTRAKRVNLCVRPHTGLEVVVPKRFDQSRIPQLLQENSQWIEKKLQKWSNVATEMSDWPPTELRLRAIDQIFNVSLSQISNVETITVELLDEEINLKGNTEDRELLLKAIEAALKEIARPLLAKQLEFLAIQNGLVYNRVTVRGQKTRWGSCSSKGNISLNYKLLFLPPPLVRYVLLHELAHTRYLNHSPAFWSVLSGFDPEARKLDGMLQDASHYVPWWANE